MFGPLETDRDLRLYVDESTSSIWIRISLHIHNTLNTADFPSKRTKIRIKKADVNAPSLWDKLGSNTNFKKGENNHETSGQPVQGFNSL